MIQAAVGYSNDVDSADAMREAIAQCRAQMQAPPKAAFLFASYEQDHDALLAEFNRAFPGLPLIGGTSTAQITSSGRYAEDSVALILFASDDVEFGIGLGRNLSVDPLRAAREAVQEAKSNLSAPPTLAIAFPESLTTSGERIIEGLKAELGTAFPIFGGTTSDSHTGKGTFQYFRTERLTDSLPVLLLSGNVRFSFAVRSGYKPIGKKRTATKVKGNRVYELDGESLLDLYQKYLGDINLVSPEYPLAVFENGSDQFYLRTSQFFDAKDGCVIFDGDIPEGAVMQFTDGTRSDLLDAAGSAVRSAIQAFPGQPRVALIFSCATRVLTLGTKVKEEYTVLDSVRPGGCCAGGFYVYGEIAPLERGGPTCFHNATFVTLLLG